MGADTKQLRNRIKSVDSTLHLTRAMGLVASSKIRRATDGMLKGRAYAAAVDEVVGMLTACPECSRSPYLAQREGERVRYVVIAGDRGLAGGYNANIFRLMRDLPEGEVYPIGKRACERFHGKLNYAETYSYQDAAALAHQLCEDFAAGEFDRLGIVSTRYVSMLTQEAQVEWILPLKKGEAKATGIIFEPDEVTMLAAVIHEYVAGKLMAAVRESFASEVAARRMAMDSAGKNAQEMIDNLQLAYNRARQGAITQEITEIVAGSGQ